MLKALRGEWRAKALGTGLRALGASGLPRLAAAYTRGLGAILMFHHVRPWENRSFALNRGLEITPEFLDEALGALRANGFDIVSLDQAIARVREGKSARPFAALTFDDGYRDNLEHALPVLERHDAPFAIYVVPEFAEGTGRLWWLELEAAAQALPEIRIGGETLPARTLDEKMVAFVNVYWKLRDGPEQVLYDTIGDLARQAGVETGALTRRYCMTWDEIAGMAQHPLCTIGAHTMSHRRLAKLDAAEARREMAQSRDAIEARLGRRVLHFAYPVGDPTSAGPREFDIAADLGFRSAVTTRKGMIFAEHAERLADLPRLSVNGEFQRRDYLDLLLTGAPFWLWNRGRRIAA